MSVLDNEGHDPNGLGNRPRDFGRIVAAAIKQNGMVCSMERPARHHDVIREMARAGIPIPIVGEQGFITSDGVFVGRRLAKLIAGRAGQIIGERRSESLFSEDLW